MTTGRINQVCRCHPELQQSNASATPLGDITTIINKSPDTAKQAGQVMRMQHCCSNKLPSRLPSLSHLMRRHQAGPSTTWWKTPSSAKHRAHNLTPRGIWRQRGEEVPQAPKLGWSMRCCFTEDVNTQRVSTSTYNAAEALQHSDSWRNKQQQDQPGPRSRVGGWTRSRSWLKRQSSQKHAAQRATGGTREFPWPPYIYRI